MTSLTGRRQTVSKFRPVIENLESRELLSSYFISTDSQYAALSSKKLVAGDTVLLKGGTTFHGRLYLDPTDAGNASSPVTITSYDPKTNAAISSSAAASARATISAGSGDGIFVWDTAGVTIKGLNIVGSGATVNKGAGINFYSDKGGTSKLSGVTIDHVDVSGFKMYGIQLGGGVGKGGFSNIKITYSNSHDNAYGGIHTYGAFSSTSTSYTNSNVYIGYCNVYNNAGIANQTKPYGNGIYLSDVTGATVERSKAYYNGANNTSGTGPEGFWAYDANAVIFQYNESHHNYSKGADGGGFDLDGGVSNSIIRYNYSHDNAGFGLAMYQFSGQRKWINNAIYNNVSSNNGLHDNSVEAFLWTSGPAMYNAQIYTNTLVVNTKSEAFLSMVQSNVQASIYSNTIQIGGVVNASRVGVSA